MQGFPVNAPDMSDQPTIRICDLSKINDLGGVKLAALNGVGIAIEKASVIYLKDGQVSGDLSKGKKSPSFPLHKARAIEG